MSTPALESRPDLSHLFINELFCFDLLYRSEPIAVTDILAYAKIVGTYDLEKYVRVVKALEIEALLDKADREKKQMQSVKKGGSTSSGRGSRVPRVKSPSLSSRGRKRL